MKIFIRRSKLYFYHLICISHRCILHSHKGGGGKHMAMMNALTQQCKACNHPDSFEPRSVVTPFVLENTQLNAPSCVAHVVQQLNNVITEIVKNHAKMTH